MKKVFKILFNKYLLTAAAFVVWMTFFDQNDWMTQQETQKELKTTREYIHSLTAQTEQMEMDLKRLQSDPQRLEQFAREKYRMKRDNEDLYIIERK
ncbi:MAG: septum formation initiator family protein [Chitinophagaceae bacterium]|nr:septum formation initiator family protein [Chitinophagaceae bacterium]